MSVVIRVPTALRSHTGGEARVEVEGDTVEEALAELAERHPRLRRHLFDEGGRLRSFVNVYRNDEDVRYLDVEATSLRDGDVLTLLPSIAGGAPDQFQPPLSQQEVFRYSRHLIMPEVGIEGQRKLKGAKVLLVGAGGLGAPAGLYLAAAGVGRMGLVDFDRVDRTNLQRQVLYGTEDIGRPKLEAAAERLCGVNPHVELTLHETRLTSENALDVLEPYDVVVDGTDNFPTRYLVNDACVMLGKPNVYGSIFRFEGQTSVFAAPGGPCYRCLYREPPPPGLVPSCAEGGVLGVLPGIVGSLQALEAMKLILGCGKSLVGRMLLFDALEMAWRELEVRRDPDCPVCGEHPTQTDLIDYEVFCGVPTVADRACPPEEVPSMTVRELAARLARGERITIVDVREPHEWGISNLATHGACLIPVEEIGERCGELDPADEIVLHCRSGVRSVQALRELTRRGFSRVYNLKGGINAWAEEVDEQMLRY